MMPTISVVLGALVFGLCAAFILLPMSKEIPVRLEAQWARELESRELDMMMGPRKSALPPYTFFYKAVIVSVAILLGFVVVATYGGTAAGAAYSLYYLGLLLLVAINVKHMLLPDSIVLGTLWIGLLYHAYSGGATDHVYGAVAGYMVPFLIAFAFKAATGKNVLGQGDLKTLAMAGAWFGIAALPILLGTFVVGFIVWGIGMRFIGPRSQGIVPTGPAHLLASLAVTLGMTAFI
jgi:prepilin signal peptidase PulO-like enzyme (type II secretory pathway)